jgi:spore germination cell wall hydrolase CwlJ-like protein
MRILYSLVFVSLLSVGFISKINAWDENGEVACLAEAIYFESGNQSDAGRLAVGHVVLNRQEMREYPNTICDVVHQAEYRENWKGNMIPVKHRCQFSYFCDGKPEIIEDSKTWNESYMLATLLVNGMYDFTHGASHYHNDSVHPYWADHLKHTVTIDNHIFYK